MKGTVTTIEKKGPRPYQEDRHLRMALASDSRSCGELLAVMDGHGGSSVAELCKQQIDSIFQFSGPDQSEESLRNLIAELASRTNYYEMGSTISMALITETPLMASVAILGDSPVVIYDKQGRLHISPEHNVRSNLEERKAAERRGGIYREGYICPRGGFSGLQMSRALGDSFLRGVLSREPDVYTIAEPVWVLVASDGLFDPGHSDTHRLLEEIKQYAKRNATAEELMRWAEKRGLQDNATALVWCAG